VTGKLTWNIDTDSHKNGAATSYLEPTLLAGRAWGRFNVQTLLSGELPAESSRCRAGRLNGI